MQHHQMILFFLLILFLSLVTESFPWFPDHHQKTVVKRSTSDECCVSSKLNVGSKKANNGRDFFRRLSTEADSYKRS